MIATATCKNCKTNWGIGEKFDGIDPSILDAFLGTVQVRCPTGICGGRLATIAVIDTSTKPPTILTSPQDGAGRPLYIGCRVRFREEERLVLGVKVGKNEAGASLLNLEGLDEPVSEWSVDRVSPVSEGV